MRRSASKSAGYKHFPALPLQLFRAFRVYKQHTIAWRRLCDVNTLIYPRRTAASKTVHRLAGSCLAAIFPQVTISRPAGVPCGFALRPRVDYDSRRMMMKPTDFSQCDGCGRAASSEHIARRLQRLEWTTRYRPVHIGTALLGAYAPHDDAEFLYSEGGDFGGEAKHVLAAAGVASAGKSWQGVLTEFQRGGFLLTYALECPIDPSVGEAAVQALLEARLPALLARIRRSLKPKRIVPISRLLEPVLGSLSDADTGSSLVLDEGRAFALDGIGRAEAALRLRLALRASAQDR
jgi:hypothetical protein